MSTTTQAAVATIDIPAGTIHDTSYECAAWYRTFEHPAQTVEVRLGGNFALWTIQGRTTHEHFPSLFGGVAIGGGRMGDCDEPSTYTVQAYNYNAAAMVEAGTMTLTDIAEISETFHDHPEFCMGYVTNYDAPIGSGSYRYAACGHDSHDDAHGKPVTERNDRGNLPRGYAPGVTTRKRHIKIIEV